MPMCPIGSHVTCEDLPGDKSGLDWSDGKYDCRAYAEADGQGEAWCETYGNTPFVEGRAKEKCCVCGGGKCLFFACERSSQSAQYAIAHLLCWKCVPKSHVLMDLMDGNVA